jgi:hypothetical protein
MTKRPMLTSVSEAPPEFILKAFPRTWYHPRWPRTAILATDATVADYGRLHALLNEGSLINDRVFQDCEEAAQWAGRAARPADC